MMRDYSEKRDFHRMQVNSEIRLTDDSGNSLTGICRDLSGTGMQLQTDRPFSEGEELAAVLLSPGEDFPPFETRIRVIRCEPVAEGFLLGIGIIEVMH